MRAIFLAVCAVLGSAQASAAWEAHCTDLAATASMMFDQAQKGTLSEYLETNDFSEQYSNYIDFERAVRALDQEVRVFPKLPADQVRQRAAEYASDVRTRCITGMFRGLSAF